MPRWNPLLAVQLKSCPRFVSSSLSRPRIVRIAVAAACGEDGSLKRSALVQRLNFVFVIHPHDRSICKAGRHAAHRAGVSAVRHYAGRIHDQTRRTRDFLTANGLGHQS